MRACRESIGVDADRQERSGWCHRRIVRRMAPTVDRAIGSVEDSCMSNRRHNVASLLAQTQEFVKLRGKDDQYWGKEAIFPACPLQTQPAPSVSPIRLAVGSRHTQQARRSCQRAGPSPGPPLAQPREIPCCAGCLHRMRNTERCSPRAPVVPRTLRDGHQRRVGVGAGGWWPSLGRSA